jgi:hypothetical protein
MKTLNSLFLFFFLPNLFGQNCDCSSQLDFTIKFYEQNNPAFQTIKTIPKTYNLYLKEVQRIKKEAENKMEIDYCIIYLDQYVTLLKDHHSDIGFNLSRIDLSTPDLIADFKKSQSFKQFKKEKIDSNQITSMLSIKNTEDIEGIYSNGTSIVFGIVNNKNDPNSYLGLVLKSNKLLELGHVLLELTRTQDNTFNVTYNVGLMGFNFQKLIKSQKIENGLIPSFGFSKISPTSNEKEYELKELNDSTNYIKLSSFDGKLTDELNAFYDSIHIKIISKPYLIIDIRNNGGGSEKSYLNMLKYAYTNPLKIDSALVWVSEENIKRYEEESEEKNKELINRMKSAKPYTFIPQALGGENTWSLDSAMTYPKKIALLYNRGTASAAEGMIVYFSQSNKVITVGENSGGYMGYGNVMTSQTPCGKYTIRSTTTKYIEKSKFEFIGIEPKYKPAQNENWILFSEYILQNSH